MPAKPAWLLMVPEIVMLLESFDAPVVDRAIVEHLFGLRRRRAIELLHRFGGYQAGRTFLVDRRLLIDSLRRLAEGDEFERESRRKQRLEAGIDQLRRHQAAARVRIPVQRTYSAASWQISRREWRWNPDTCTSFFLGRKICWRNCTSGPRPQVMITTGSARRQNRPIGEARDLCRWVHTRGHVTRAEQGAVKARMELR